MLLLTTRKKKGRLMRLVNRRKSSERLTVNECVEMLARMTQDLEVFDKEKDGHLKRLEREKVELEKQAEAAKTEKNRGVKIVQNIKNLLAV